MSFVHPPMVLKGHCFEGERFYSFRFFLCRHFFNWVLFRGDTLFIFKVNLAC